MNNIKPVSIHCFSYFFILFNQKMLNLENKHQQAQISQKHPSLWNSLYSKRTGYIPSCIVMHVYLIKPARIHLFYSLYIFPGPKKKKSVLFCRIK